jgi:hypothetical protein
VDKDEISGIWKGYNNKNYEASKTKILKIKYKKMTPFV